MVLSATFPVFANGALTTRTWTLVYDAPYAGYAHSCATGTVPVNLQRLKELKLPPDLAGSPKYQFTQTGLLTSADPSDGRKGRVLLRRIHVLSRPRRRPRPELSGTSAALAGLHDGLSDGLLLRDRRRRDGPPIDATATCTEDNEVPLDGLADRRPETHRDRAGARARLDHDLHAVFVPVRRIGLGVVAGRAPDAHGRRPSADRPEPGGLSRPLARAGHALPGEPAGRCRLRRERRGRACPATASAPTSSSDSSRPTPTSRRRPRPPVPAPPLTQHSARAGRSARSGGLSSTTTPSTSRATADSRANARSTARAAARAARTTSCAYSNSAGSWESNGRHYENEIHSGSLGNDGRTTFTDWAPVNWSTGPAAGGACCPTCTSSAASPREPRSATSSSSSTPRAAFSGGRSFTTRPATSPSSAAATRTAPATSTRSSRNPSRPRARPRPRYCSNNHPVFPSSVGTDGDSFGKDYVVAERRASLGPLDQRLGRDDHVLRLRSYDARRDDGLGHGLQRQRRPDDALRLRRRSAASPRSRRPAAGEHRTFVCYEGPNATTAYRAATAQACPVAPSNANAKTWEHFDYDGLGRLAREKTLRPGAGVSKRFQLFDAAGNAVLSLGVGRRRRG